MNYPGFQRERMKNNKVVFLKKNCNYSLHITYWELRFRRFNNFKGFTIRRGKIEIKMKVCLTPESVFLIPLLLNSPW